MITNLINWFKPAVSKTRHSEEEIQRIYPKYRWHVLESTFLGYAPRVSFID
jgi:OPA family glycerol-3-phosphate transporter-like MFS transporter